MRTPLAILRPALRYLRTNRAAMGIGLAVVTTIAAGGAITVAAAGEASAPTATVPTSVAAQAFAARATIASTGSGSKPGRIDTVPSHGPIAGPTLPPGEARSTAVVRLSRAYTARQPSRHRGTPTEVCAGSAVWSNLDACAWPGPATTGYPAGQTFRNTVTGGLTITRDGTVIDGWKVTGGIQVRAKGVTIRNSWVTSDFGGRSGSGVINLNPGSSAAVDHNLLDGLNATHACIWHEGVSLTATHNECTGTNDGIFSWATTEGTDGSGDNFSITDNWLHGFTTEASNGHVDGYQTEGARHGLIRHNTIDVSQEQNSAIAIWNGRKSSTDITVDDNLLAGGGFTVYAEDYSPSESNPAGGYTVTDITFTDNRFSTVHFGCVGYWGVWFPRGAPTDGWHRSGNMVLETGQDVDAGNPTNRGAPCN